MSFAWLSPEETHSVLRYLEERFGIPAGVLEGHRLFRRGGYVWAVRPEAADLCGELRVAGGGLRLVREMGPGRYKPATRGIQAFGGRACRNVLDVQDGQLRALIQGQALPAPEGMRGFILVRWKGQVLGVALVRNGQIQGQFPRALTEHLRLGPGEWVL